MVVQRCLLQIPGAFGCSGQTHFCTLRTPSGEPEPGERRGERVQVPEERLPELSATTAGPFHPLFRLAGGVLKQFYCKSVGNTLEESEKCLPV